MQLSDRMVEEAVKAFNNASMCGIYEYDNDALIAAIEAAIQAAWVSVDDALPKPFHDVLVYRPRKTTADIPTYEISHHNGERFYGNSYPPSHWMTIPAYKGDQK